MQKHINSETEMCRLIDKILGVLSLCKLYAPQDFSDRSLITDNGVNLLAQVYAAIIACNADENSETIQNGIAIYNSWYNEWLQFITRFEWLHHQFITHKTFMCSKLQ